MSPKATDALPVTRLDSAEIPREDQFDAWHQASAPLFDTALASDPATFSASVTCYLVDSLIFTRTQFDRMRFSRGTAHLVGGETDCITVQYYKTGAIRGCLDDGTPLIMTPDRISIQDFAHAYSGFGQTTEQYGVVIPRDQVSARDRIYRHRPMFSWGLDSPQGRLLTSALAAIWQELPRATQAQAGALASGFAGLLNGLLAAEPTPDDAAQIERATLRAMQEYLCSNLERADLGVDDLCRTFRCSRATAYRLFQESGGILAYLRDLRLGHCYRELCLASGPGTKRVREVAERWGFHNASHFHRLFKQRFDIPPSEVLAASARSSPSMSDSSKAGFLTEVERIRGWLQRC